MAGRIIKPKKSAMHPMEEGIRAAYLKREAERAQVRAPELAKKEAAEKAALTAKFIDEQHVRTPPTTGNVPKKPKLT
jgi:hypothetical protein